MRRDEIVAFLNDYLEIGRIRDFGPNGLQVVGRDEVERVMLAVSISAEVLEQAAASRADLVLVHHGLFWEGESRVVGALLRRRLRLLLDNDLTLLAYHLPLDRHPLVGNNARILSRLGLQPVETEAPLDEVGYIGEAPEPIPAGEFVDRVNRLFQTQSYVELSGLHAVRRVSVLSGSGGRLSTLLESARRGCDLHVTGSASEPAPAAARELGLGLIASGHYNTEKLGVLALGELLSQRFNISTFFVDLPNPL